VADIEAWSKRLDPKAVEWAKRIEAESKSHFQKSLRENKCKGCASSNVVLDTPEDTSFFVAMSFSLPKESWLTLSKEMEGEKAVFILRGIPNNSFKEFAKKILDLKRGGMNATVQIDPDAFEKFKIESVPSFIIVAGNKYDKISGNISFSFAQRELNRIGECKKIKKEENSA
jgi:conjugal transfer pilus assembly protein TrbC